MRILVTGGAGFIGSNFIRYMLGKHPDYSVVNLDKLTYAGNLDNLRDVEKNKNYRFVKGDICDEKVVSGLAKDTDVIVNFAAETHVDRSIFSAGSFVQTDVYGTYVLLEASKKYKHKRYIQISTDEAYGSIDTGSFDENSPVKPNSPYAASKSGAEMLVRSYVVTYALPGIITRSSNNFGPYQYPEKLIPLFVTNALEDKSLPMYGDGLNVRDWLYVIDNCEALDLILHKGVAGEIYNVGGGNELSNIELTGKILKLLGKPESLIVRVKDRPGHDRRYSVNCEKIKKQLQWKPRHDFQEALKETVSWYENNRKWWMNIKQKQKEYLEFYKKQYTP
jgi:dTDP-glucose 4,6-dehydratase